ncbi:YgiQ family radical SAM protein [Methanorbis furvi]
MTPAELKNCGIDRPDVILISGDAYVDHPSFAAALLGRALWDAGFTVGIITQPEWRDRDYKHFTKLGRPKLFFAVVPGAVDPMVNAYTPALKKRSQDSYSPGGKLNRPERTTIVYTNAIHKMYPQMPIVIGGIEASMRRFAHYDYWSDSVRQGILADAPASLLVYGMGELALIEIANKLRARTPVKEIRDVPGTCWTMSVGEYRKNPMEDAVILPAYPNVTNREIYGKSFASFYQETKKPIVQQHPKTVIVANTPMRPMTTEELDHLYELPFTRKQHPIYKEKIPALEPVQFSLVTHRGCFGNCSFCAITHHQGRIITSRSEESLIREAKRMIKMPEFRGTIQDVGGPTANMYAAICQKWEEEGPCRNKQCTSCKERESGAESHISLLRNLRELPGVKHVFISSGIRYDLIPPDPKGDKYLTEIMRYHISGHMKIAPEHIASKVTELMHKPTKFKFDVFINHFEQVRDKLEKKTGKRMYLLPYMMSSHPGCTINDMIELALYLREKNLYTEQVQDFTPVPMTLSTAMYYSGLNPLTGCKVHVPVGNEKLIQRAILHWKDPSKYDYVVSGLARAGRKDLIGDLVPKSEVKRRLKK